MKELLQYVINNNQLTKEEAEEAMFHIGRGEVNQSMMTSFITVFMYRGIAPQELLGFRNALLELSIPVDFSDFDTMDMCGTGGDGKNTFNVSTISSLVLAASSVKVAKHGNYGVSSAVGSSNVIESLGYKFTNNTDQLKKELDKAGITFLHAPLFHPAMKHVAPIRKELGMKTFFNLLGPLVNPSKPNKQLTGVYSKEILPLYKYVLDQATENYAIAFSLDVYDEISLTGDFLVVQKSGEKVYSPKDLGFTQTKQSEIDGGETVEEAAKILISIISGQGSKAQNEVIAANAGLAISIGKDISFEAGIAEAKEILASGKAASVLKKLLEINKG
ncbi:MAG: anthranilate phosphoribosyltransferase [Flavobacteriales bacterium]